MVKYKKKYAVLAVILSLGLLLLSGFALADNGFSEDTKENIKGIIREKYNNLPKEQFVFTEDTAATFDGIEFRPFKNLALSEANLEDGIVAGLLAFEGETRAVLIATKLPGNMEPDYASGLILPSNDKVVSVAKVDFRTHDQSPEEINFTFKDSGEGSNNLILEITGIRYLLSTFIPKSL